MNTVFAPAPRADAELQASALRVLSERFGVDDWVQHPHTQPTRKSTVLLLRSARGGQVAALKLYRAARAALRQAAALRHGAPLRGTGFDVPELYRDFPERNALLVEWVPTRHLEQVLVRAAAWPPAHWAAVRATGAWLRRFHALDAIAPQAFAAARPARLFEQRLVAAPLAASALAREPLWVAARNALERMLAAADGIVVPHALTHGDFTSTNILLGAGRVTGIDVWAERRLPVADDLARMFVYLAMGDLQPLHARIARVPPDRRRAQRALFEGYGADLAPEGDFWRTLVLYEALARWLALEQRLARRPDFTEAWKRAGLRAILRGLGFG